MNNNLSCFTGINLKEIEGESAEVNGSSDFNSRNSCNSDTKKCDAGKSEYRVEIFNIN